MVLVPTDNNHLENCQNWRETHAGTPDHTARPNPNTPPIQAVTKQNNTVTTQPKEQTYKEKKHTLHLNTQLIQNKTIHAYKPHVLYQITYN